MFFLSLIKCQWQRTSSGRRSCNEQAMEATRRSDHFKDTVLYFVWVWKKRKNMKDPLRGDWFVVRPIWPARLPLSSLFFLFHSRTRKFSLTDAFSLSISNGWKQTSPSHNWSERNCAAYIEKETLTSAVHYPILFLSFLLKNNNTPALRLLNVCTKGLRKPTACFFS